ncbi:MAG: hypothetical protein Kow00121_53940 [Elainellaceae cyanobacterium]
MTTDPTIREQTYQYFLQEAPELLQALEQSLLEFKDHHGIQQVNNLMRVTHTLKGAATSVGLETIATVAHSLEDIFKVLCNPNASVDLEVEALLFEGVECLRLPLIAELTGRTIDQSEVLDRAATIFAQLQENLGDFFGQNTPLPTSAELGFDITQSIFEVGVTQRLEQLAAAIAETLVDLEALDSGTLDSGTLDSGTLDLVTLTHSHAEVLLGLAESLNLKGFGAIAQATLIALDRHPEQVVLIAETALADWRAGQAAVLAGDRSQGGQVSDTLQHLAGFSDLAALGDGSVQEQEPDHSSLFSESNTESNIESNADMDVDANAETINSLLNNIWGGQAVLFESGEELEEASPLAIVSKNQNRQTLGAAVPLPQSAVGTPIPIAQRDFTAPSPQVRVNVKHLEQLNDAVGELLTNHNRQLLQAEQLKDTAQSLLNRLKQHQQLLNQLRGWANQPSASPKSRKSRRSKKQRSSSAQASSSSQFANAAIQPDLDRDTHSQLIQALLDDMVQLTEVADAIDWFSDQSLQSLDHQRQLLTNTRGALIEARMLPLGGIFNRLPPILQQLETLHNKQVTLKLQGTDVLVDKVVAEKLYDPLLHLIRNAFDHGIEPVTVRQQQGKAAQGSIVIDARSQGKYLIIEVRDDGKGLDFEQILKRAIERQLILPEQAMSLDEPQLINLLFEPGFSTATQVNDLSGRGIGLDVVRDQIQALRGSVTIQTEPEQGTTFVLQIPLNLTIAPLLVCESASKSYALLDDAIEQIIIPKPEQIQERKNCKVLQWRQDEESATSLIPVYSLTDVLTYQSPISLLTTMQSVKPINPTIIKPIILLYAQGNLIGLEVDQLIGKQELVIRPLGAIVEAPDYVHGASILADRRLALVIDGAVLLQSILEQQAGKQSAQGSRATTIVPSLLPAATSIGQLPQVPILAGSSQTIAASPVRLLVVDDSITTRQTLALTLQKANYQVIQAQNGHEALNQLQHQPDVRLVICDLEMPGMNGFEFLRQIQSSAFAHLPIIILTSRSDESYRTMALQLGAAAYTTKPYIDRKLLTLVSDLLAREMVNSI